MKPDFEDIASALMVRAIGPKGDVTFPQFDRLCDTKGEIADALCAAYAAGLERAAEIERLRVKVQELEIELAAEKAFRGLPVKVMK